MVGQLFTYKNFIARALDDGYRVHSIYTDFSKSFDLLEQAILLKKLEEFGVRGSLFSWLSSLSSTI